MQRYIVRRAILFIPTLILASLLIFGLMRILPGDVALHILSMGGEQSFREEQLIDLRDRLGLNDPIAVQYSKWAWSLVKGDWGGESLVSREDLGSLISRRLPVTLQLTAYTLIIALTVSVPLGVLAALRQDKLTDYVIRVLVIVGAAMPNFWVALMAILFFVVFFNWSPPIIYQDLWENPKEHMLLMIFPALILAWGYSAQLVRLTRAQMLEVLRQDYIRTARSKGLSEHLVIMRHALRNVMIPVITLAGLYVEALLGGTVILETVFGLPGIGSGIVEGAQSRDFPIVQTFTMLLMAMVLSVNLLIDIAYAWIDPRVSYD